MTTDPVLERAAFDLRQAYEEKHGCNISMTGECVRHPKCEYARRVSTVCSFTTIDSLLVEVDAWAKERGLYEVGASTPRAQTRKTQEELDELKAALVLHETLPDSFSGAGRTPMEEAIDAYGDILVTLQVGAHLAGIELKDALQVALKEISKRRGKVVQGLFVKEKP